MKFRVYTYSGPLQIVLCLEKNVDAVIKGYHPTQDNTVFFDQRIDKDSIAALDGKIAIGCPMVPENFMIVELSGPKLLGIETRQLSTRPLYLPPKDEVYVECAEWFAYQCGILKPDTYTRNGITFELFDVIRDNGKKQETPARVDHETGIVQIAKRDFDGFSIPVRLAVLGHERIHYVKDTTNEEVADKNSDNIWLCRGYPKMELIYAATKILGNDAASKKRADSKIDFINNW